MPDEDNVIDVDVVDETDNLPAVIEDRDTHTRQAPIEAERLTPDGRQWPHGPTPDRRCKAHKKNGEQCRNASIPGATVCRYHGGAAPHVKAAARARLDNAADLMAKQLLGIAVGGESEAVRLQAIRDALDRAGVSKPTEVVVSPGQPKQPWEEVYEGLSGMSRQESRRARGVSDASDDYAGLEGAHLHARSQGGAECQCPNPPTQQHSPDQTGKWDSCARRESLDPTAYPSDDDYLGETAASGQHEASYSPYSPMHRPRPRRFDRDRQSEGPQPPRSQVHHITGDDAMRVANEVNLAIGALPPPKAIESPHKRYPRP